MITALTVIQTSKESVFIKQGLIKVGMKVVASPLNVASYLKALQYDPAVVIMELGENPRAQIEFLKLVKANKTISSKPFVLYGPPMDPKLV